MQAVATLGDMGDPPVTETDLGALLIGQLAWCQHRVGVKLAGLTDERLRTPHPLRGWSPLGLVQHLRWVGRRWIEWGHAGRKVQPYPAGGDAEEWTPPPGVDVLGLYRRESAGHLAYARLVGLDARAVPGGRFRAAAEAPTMGRILMHLLQETSRHLGHLDIARELVDGATGE